MTEHPTTELPFVDRLPSLYDEARRRNADRRLREYMDAVEIETERLKQTIGELDDITQCDK